MLSQFRDPLPPCCFPPTSIFTPVDTTIASASLASSASSSSSSSPSSSSSCHLLHPPGMGAGRVKLDTALLLHIPVALLALQGGRLGVRVSPLEHRLLPRVHVGPVHRRLECHGAGYAALFAEVAGPEPGQSCHETQPGLHQPWRRRRPLRDDRCSRDAEPSSRRPVSSSSSRSSYRSYRSCGSCNLSSSGRGRRRRRSRLSKVPPAAASPAPAVLLFPE